MAHYLDIHLLPDPEFPSAQLMSALYSKLHRALVLGRCSTIATAFPGYDLARRQLGSTLRLVGPLDDLSTLMAIDWMRGMRDHTKLSTIDTVPRDATHQQLRRVQAKSSPQRLRRRHMKRHGLTEAEALARIPDSARETLNLPFVNLQSQSTGQPFRIFLRLQPALDGAQSGPFNAYGLSTTATVPWF